MKLGVTNPNVFVTEKVDVLSLFRGFKLKVITEPKELLKIRYDEQTILSGWWHHRDKNPSISSDYGELTYQCGCEESHILRDTDFTFIARPVKFLFHCSNNYLTSVRVKGLFTAKIISNWSCTVEVFDKMEELNRQMLEEMRNTGKE
jgi:hypothetical protein